VGWYKSFKLINLNNNAYKTFGLVAKKSDDTEEPSADDLYKVGTVAHIIKMLRMPDGNTTIIIQGKKRFKIIEYVQSEPYHKARVTAFDEKHPPKADKEFQAIISNLKETSTQIVKISPNIPSDAGFAINNIESPTFLVNFISSNMNAKTTDKQKMLEVADLKERSLLVLEYLNKEFQMLELRNQIQNKTKMDLDKQQREYFLNQQIKTIQEELGGNNFEQEISGYKEKALTKKWNDEIKEVFEKQISKLQRMNPNAAEHGIQTNYVELLLELPWDEVTKDNFDLKNAQQILDEDHFGLEKVKQRIIEHLAVLKLKGNLKSPIICLYGPPGVGKTSLGNSIA
jgi:ATP-dependent Lon protease